MISDDFNWSIQKGPTSTQNSGPSGDHTTGDDFYIYIEVSGRDPGDTAVIYSEWIPPMSAGGCLRFVCLCDRYDFT